MPRTVYTYHYPPSSKPGRRWDPPKYGPYFADTKFYAQYWNSYCKRRDSDQSKKDQKKNPDYVSPNLAIIGDNKTVIDTHCGTLHGPVMVDFTTTIYDMISYLEQHPLTVSMGEPYLSTHICVEVLQMRMPYAPMSKNLHIELDDRDIQPSLDQLVKLDLIERYKVGNFDAYYKTKKKSSI